MLLVPVLLTGLTGCSSRELDTRCQVEAEGSHRDTLSAAITESDLWHFDAQTGTQELVQFSLEMDRDQFETIDGDYDPGEVQIGLEIEHLESGTMLFRKDVDVDLESFMIGLFDENATREEIQEIAFQATEERITPYLNRWVELAAIRAMAVDGGDEFVPILSEVLEDKWCGTEMRNEARRALAQIRG
jgi:hypothetical protein